MVRVDILIHALDSFLPHYFLHEIGTVWQEAGIEVFVAQGPEHPPRGDAVVLHTDITKVPVDYLAAARSYPIAINGRVADISKRLVSRNLITRPEDHDGQVIVKTDRNAGGLQESFFAGVEALPSGSFSGPADYRIYQSTNEVPPGVWSDRHLVVERFLPEMRDECYCLRTWIFFGDRETNSLSYSEEPIAKQRTIIKREPVAEVPDELRQLREELAFDFGKFDYAIVGEEVVLYDANRTPTLGNFPKDQYMPRIRVLAQGLACFLDVKF